MSRCFNSWHSVVLPQMPLPTTESSGAMTDASKRRFEDAEFEVDTEPDWVVGSSFMEPVGGTEDLATKALLPAGITNMAMWGKTKFAFGKYKGEKKSYKNVFKEGPQLCFMVSKTFDQRLSEGVLPGIGPGTLRPEIWWTAKRLMCHSMQELPCVESFVIDDTVMVVGSIQDLILCGQL